MWYLNLKMQRLRLLNHTGVYNDSNMKRPRNIRMWIHIIRIGHGNGLTVRIGYRIGNNLIVIIFNLERFFLINFKFIRYGKNCCIPLVNLIIRQSKLGYQLHSLIIICRTDRCCQIRVCEFNLSENIIMLSFRKSLSRNRSHAKQHQTGHHKYKQSLAYNLELWFHK